ncbi:S-adenosyl-L-methionine-dependent methyltransferase [Colletotrichum phormii]|uniref:S-adenosyl-L-methionine-dependent methyltransferase n=1 Tax=Colletotrichum phormii TaxID=359342 RepID=A0AAJ0A210_9PEZI|nr:S-adenosyl-L-methionine-dependent methyltransferase [Colletotrichum phormii]KAK1654966.1 S-adenosyl-L-methionine-dependent methyltransferase [Colletotrichum phormii]
MSGQVFANEATAASPAHASEEPRSNDTTTICIDPQSSTSDPVRIDPLLPAEDVGVVVDDVTENAESSDYAASFVDDLDMFPGDDDDDDEVPPGPAPLLALILDTETETETETAPGDMQNFDDADVAVYAAADRLSLDTAEDEATGAQTTNDADSLMTGTENQSIITLDAPSSPRDERVPSTRTIMTEDLRLAFQKRFGRTYPSRDYILPNDWDECIRLAIQHHLWLYTYNKRLANSPKRERAARVLDCGTGTGHWASDFADDHPEAIVIGVDLSPIQLNAVPPNLFYEIYDLEQPWPWREPFDFIFFRHMNTAFADWVEIFEKALGHLEPGGYIELQDNSFPIMCDDDTMPPNSAIARWSTLLMEATELMGRPCNAPSSFKQLLDLAGFEAIIEEKTIWPIGPWNAGNNHPRDREIGVWCRENCLEALEASTMHLFTQFLHWSEEDTRDFCDEVEREICGGGVHAYFTV